MKWSFGLAGAFCLMAVSACSQPRSAATDHPAARAVAESPTTDDSSVAASAEPETASSADPDAASAPSAPSEQPVKPPPPPADRTPTRPGDAEKITWEDLNLGMPADVVFRPLVFNNDRVKELEGKRISIIGYMHGGQLTQRGIKDFILLKNTQCKFGPGGQADHLANVIMREGAATIFTPSPVKVEGTLKMEPFEGPDGNTWYIYRLEDAQIR
jgi:hypothetical protein